MNIFYLHKHSILLNKCDKHVVKMILTAQLSTCHRVQDAEYDKTMQ